MGTPWATRDDPGCSREPSRGASELARGLPRRSRSVPKAPDSTPRRPWEVSGALFQAFFSQSVSQEAPGAISDRILGRPREVRGLSHCTGAVFREGQPFFDGAAEIVKNIGKNDPREALGTPFEASLDSLEGLGGPWGCLGGPFLRHLRGRPSRKAQQGKNSLGKTSRIHSGREGS